MLKKILSTTLVACMLTAMPITAMAAPHQAPVKPMNKQTQQIHHSKPSGSHGGFQKPNHTYKSQPNHSQHHNHPKIHNKQPMHRPNHHPNHHPEIHRDHRPEYRSNRRYPGPYYGGGHSHHHHHNDELVGVIAGVVIGAILANI